jgi:Domain of unknown function (DUF4258)
MFERGISQKTVRRVAETGEIIEDFRDEPQAPSRLILGFQGKRPIHVVVFEKSQEDEMVIVTAYVPGSDQWKDHYRSRRS